MNDLTTNTDFQELLAVIGLGNSDAVPSATEMKAGRIEAVRSALASSEGQAALVAALQIDGVIDHERFFSKMECVCKFLGYSDEANATAGEIWLCALRVLTADEVEANLTAFSRLEFSFWRMVRLLETIFAFIPLRVSFANDFLRHVAKRVANDFAGSIFWSAARRFVERQRAIALELLPEFLKVPDAPALELATFFIGTLRHQPLTALERCTLGQSEDAFSHHVTIECRAALLRSWATTAWQFGITHSQLISLFNHYLIADPADQQEVIAVVSRIATARAASVELREESLRWLHIHANCAKTSLAKYAIVGLAVHLSSVSDGNAELVDIDLLCAVLPIELADKGTWAEIERYLVNTLKSDLERFHMVFSKVAERDAEGILRVMREPKGFAWLKMQMTKHDVAIPISRLVFGASRAERRLGLYLFDELEIEGLSKATLNAVGDTEVQRAFYESMCVMLSGESTGRLFASFLPRVGTMSQEFQRAFFSEVCLQCRNRTGGTRAELQERLGDHPVIADIMAHTGNQCDLLKQANESSIGAMAVPGYERAGRVSRRVESIAIGQSMQEHSELLKLCKPVSLLYANRHSAYIDGRITPPSSLLPFSTNVEVPVIDFADPEGMAIRRCLAGTAISKLQQGNDGEDAQ